VLEYIPQQPAGLDDGVVHRDVELTREIEHLRRWVGEGKGRERIAQLLEALAGAIDLFVRGGVRVDRDSVGLNGRKDVRSGVIASAPRRTSSR
jgi:hypothetical protein